MRQKIKNEYIEFKFQSKDTTLIENPIERYKRAIMHYGFSITYGLWKTKTLRKIRIPNVIAPDVLVLAQGALMGKFKMEPEAILFLTMNHPPFKGGEEMYIRQIFNLRSSNKFYSTVYHNIKRLLPKYKGSILRLVLAPEEIKFLLESVKICLMAHKLNKDITQKQKIYLTLWSIHIIPYLLFYRVMPDSKILQLYAKFYEFSSKILKKVKNLREWSVV